MSKKKSLIVIIWKTIMHNENLKFQQDSTIFNQVQRSSKYDSGNS